MIPLPQKLRKNGFTCIQVLRGNRSCIYEQMVWEDVIYYEVFLIQVKPKRKVNGIWLEAREKFPHNEAFGNWAWTTRTHQEAYQKFLELEKGDEDV